MKSTGRLVALCAAIFFHGMALEAQGPSILEPRFERHQGAPYWISAEAVANEEKVVDLDLIDDLHLRTNVEKQRQSLGDRFPVEKSTVGGKPPIVTIPLSECRRSVLSSSHRGGDNPSTTLADLESYSQSIIRGKVRMIELGFGFGIPSSLMTVEVSEVIKGPAPKSPFYIEYPIAHFRIGPFHFCNGNQGFEPNAGDEVLLFDYVGSIDRDDVLYAPRFDQIFFQRQNGSLLLPSELKNTPELKAVSTLDEVVQHLRAGASPNSRGDAR